jgi:hypothetical protein
MTIRIMSVRVPGAKGMDRNSHFLANAAVHWVQALKEVDRLPDGFSVGPPESL